ncbi:Protein phosphatase 1H-like protein [Leptotrombidium deliense]|uniref:Protein phosphatase 1H-like protein n=1 Tax=Leptotrombidium deliense TaxID=299467 RepID=A0A443SGH7_9ACAR|nr:Protein phosphatase 1H-like protein [Leptotrombidium deliense]
MLNKLRSFYNSVGSLDTAVGQSTTANDANRSKVASSHSLFSLSSNAQHIDKGPPLKHRYTRPQFLQLNTDDEIQVSADHVIRPIIVPRDLNKLPWNAGYAECINAGKSARNEDQASICKGLLRAIITPESIEAKVADMMPTIPGHSRSVPIGSQREINGDTSNETTSGNESKVSSNEAENVSEQKTAVQAKLEIDKNEVSENSNSNGEMNEIVDVDNVVLASDLCSPSTPFPPEIVESFKNEISDNVFTTPPSSPSLLKSTTMEESLPWLYFGIFDGHAGSGVAVAASNTLHKIVQDKLQNIADILITFGLKDVEEKEEKDEELSTGVNSTSINHNRLTKDGSVIVNHDNHLSSSCNVALLFHPATDKIVTVDGLIIGALELAFWEMDNQIALDKRKYRMSGGCTALVALFILGKLFVSNAGDSRAIVHKNGEILPMSFDFTPESERERIKYLGLLRPEFLGSDFTHLEFVRRPTRRDIGKRLLYRDAYMTGWAYKTITHEDLKVPLIYGEGKRSRVLVTIGVTRGFGDHELRAQSSEVHIKPFLTPQPEVRLLNLTKDDNLTDSDVLIMGTDGLWDITTNEKAVEIVQKSLEHFPANDTQRFKYRYISAAQDLVMHSRGKSKERGKGWRTSDNSAATIDDISVFVIPLKPFRQEYLKWKEAHSIVKREFLNKS